jgi:ABC-type nitrate/sulfonate/bicarbonate transport system substrate-binding protein
MARTAAPLALLGLALAALALACAPAARPAPTSAPATSSPAPAAAQPAVPAASPALTSAAPARTESLRVGVLSGTTDAGIWIGLARGYFEQEALQLDQTTFGTAADMIAPLGTNQLDVGGGAPGVGLAHAILRGLDVKIVADRSNSAPGHGYVATIARKDLYDRGEVRGPADLKGRPFAISSTTGIVPEVVLNRFMQRAGLRARDAELVAMSFPDMVPAFGNKVIDAGHVLEPFLTRILENGDGVVLDRTDSIFPGHQDGVILYASGFAQRRDPAVRFIAAYLRGIRDYNDAFVKHDPAQRAAMIDILAEYTPIKDKPLYDKMQMPGFDPNGRVNVASLKEDQEYYLAAGLQERPVDFDRIVDHSYVDAAVQRLGRYQ